MPAWLVILIAAFVVVDLVVVALILLWAQRRRTLGADNAPGWFVLCTRCRSARRLADLGGIKLGATPRNTRAFVRCRGCGQRGGVRIAHVSRMSAEQLELVEAHDRGLGDDPSGSGDRAAPNGARVR